MNVDPLQQHRIQQAQQHAMAQQLILHTAQKLFTDTLLDDGFMLEYMNEVDTIVAQMDLYDDPETAQRYSTLINQKNDTAHKLAAFCFDIAEQFLEGQNTWAQSKEAAEQSLEDASDSPDTPSDCCNGKSECEHPTDGPRIFLDE